MKKYKLLVLLLAMFFIIPLSACDCKHNYSEWQTRTQVTCTTDGLEYRTCSKCGEEETREVLHEGHKYGTWQTRTQVSCIKDGLEYRTCSECENEETNTITKLAHVFTDGLHCDNCESLKNETEGLYIYDRTTYAVVGLNQNFAGDTLIIPAYHNGLPVTTIDEKAFRGNKNIKNVILPNTINDIDRWAFCACWNIESVIIGDGNVTIRSYAFQNCYNLTYFEMGTGNKTVESGYTFDQTYKLVNLVNKTSNLNLAVGVNTGKYGYLVRWARNVSTTGEDLLEITTDANGHSYYTIGTEKHYFDYNGANSEITIPEGITHIDGYCLVEGVSFVTSVTLPSTVKEIKDHAFDMCDLYHSTLVTLNLNEGLETIGACFIDSDLKVKSIVIPASVKTIKARAFDRVKLTSITFKNKTGWKYVNAKTSSVVSIDASSFDDPTEVCTKLSRDAEENYSNPGKWFELTLYRD